MSQSPESAGETSDVYARAWRGLYQLARQGKSFSGRERNCVFVNTGDGRFANASGVSGFDLPEDGRALAAVDWNLDGAPDLWLSARSAPRLRLFVNSAAADADWVALRLQGSSSNRDAIGARVEVELAGAGTRRHVRELVAGEAFLSQSSKWLSFGLGREADIEAVSVRWPNGRSERFEGVAPRARYLLVEGSGVARAWRSELGATRLSPSPALELPTRSPSCVIASAAPIPVLGLDYRDSSGEARSLAGRAGRKQLVSLWASWCPNCQRELKQWTQQAERLRAAGIDLIALSVDEPKDRAGARDALAKMGWPFESGEADTVLLERVELLLDVLLIQPEQLVLPTSLFLDEQGRLLAVVRGQASLDELLALARRGAESPEELRGQASPGEGRWILPPRAARISTLATRLQLAGHTELAARYFTGLSMKPGAEVEGGDGVSAQARLAASFVQRATQLRGEGKPRAALEWYARALEEAPEQVDTLIALGNLHGELREMREAIACFERALALAPESEVATFNLGIAHGSLGEGELARGYFEAVVRLAPRNPRGYFNLAVVHARAGRFDEAVRSAEQALALDAGHTEASALLARVHRLRSDFTSGFAACRAGLAQHPEAESLRNELALLLASTGELVAARAELAWLEARGSGFAAALRESLAGATPR